MKTANENIIGNSVEVEIIRAAKKCYLSDGISNTDMREIARVAGVARSTLYRYFTNKDAVLVATIKQEMASANADISKKLIAFDDPADILIEGLLLALKEIPKRPLLKAIYTSDTDATARRVVWSSTLIINFGKELMANVIKPALDADLLQDKVKSEVMVEWVYRILLSFLTLPSNWIHNDKDLRMTLRALLIPVILR